ncbi:MAG: hypothetical protein MUC49_07500 [Raineya sp.]|jgi:hypothetical protein|nr:hypothetical protein [Raineya sp.]
MSLRNHLHLLYLSTTFWTWFFLGGLWTNYYQDLSFINALIFIMIFPTLIFIFVGKGLLKSIAKTNYLKAAFISASYFAFVLLLYDFIYLKLYLGKTFNYLIDYWYLTFFSPIPYIILLPIGRYLDKKESET